MTSINCYKRVTKLDSRVTVNSKTGKLTVKKGTPKKAYTIKVRVTAKGSSDYKKYTKTVKVKITVK